MNYRLRLANDLGRVRHQQISGSKSVSGGRVYGSVGGSTAENILALMDSRGAQPEPFAPTRSAVESAMDRLDPPILEAVIMAHVIRFDHVGVTVRDLDKVTAFFVELGLEIDGRTFVEGEFIDTVTAIPNSRTEIVMLRTPGGESAVELSSFVRPDPEPGSPDAMANELGLRSLSFEVDDIQAHVDRMAAQGYGLVGGIGEYEGSWRMAYVRGPEGILVALAERIR